MSLPSPTNKAMTSREWGMLLTLSLLWGGSFFFNGVAVKELPTFTVVVCRVVLAAAVLIGVLPVLHVKMPQDRQVWLAFLGMGLLNNVVPFTLIVWGQAHIASGVASILNATTPLFGVLFAHFLTDDEKMTRSRVIGVAIGLLGVTVMIGADALRSLGVNIVAQAACLGAAISYAFAGIFGRRFRAMKVAPVATATGQVIASSAMMVPAMLVIDHPWTLSVPSMATMGALLGVATLSTALAYILYFRLLATAGATNLLLVTLLIPVSAMVLGFLFLNENPLPKHFLGMAMIAIGLCAIDGRLWKRMAAVVNTGSQGHSGARR
jgi:drug/metabolite transporter (DMT)-like permease